MDRQSEESIRKEAKLARQAAEQGDTGRPGDGRGRTDHAGLSNVYPASGPLPPGDARLQPMGTFGQGDRGPAGYQDSGGSEVIPPDRLTREDPAGRPERSA